MKKSVKLILVLLLLLSAATFLFVTAFSEKETTRGTLQYHLQISGFIANVPEVGNAYNTRFSRSIYDNGSPEKEVIIYCTNSKHEEIGDTVTNYIKTNKPSRTDSEVEIALSNSAECKPDDTEVKVSRIWYTDK